MKSPAFSATLAALLTTLALPEPSRAGPNVIVILADDLGWPDLGVQGAPDLLTPNIDSLAANGVRFTSGYVSCPLCSPSRAGLITGRHQQRFGFEMNPGPELEYDPIFGLPLSERTLGDRMKELGYATGWIGKSHLGAAKVGGVEIYHPLRRGFDEYFGFLEGHHGYCIESCQIEELDLDTNQMVPVPDPIQRNGTPVVETDYLTTAFGREVVDFIKRHAAQPFCIYAPFNAVHEPVDVPPDFLTRTDHLFPNEQPNQPSIRHKMAAMLLALDDAVGAILTELRAHPTGPNTTLENNTLIFFTSDNGAPPSDRFDANGSTSLPLRGNKSSLYEGGIRVPYVLQWKGTLTPRVIDAPVSTMDILPTCVAATGGATPAAWQLDGVNLLPWLRGQTTTAPHPAMFWRVETGRADEMPPGPRAMRYDHWKLVKPSWFSNWELYDLDTPNGFRELPPANQADARPDILRQLLPLFGAWEATLATPRWDYRTRDYVRPTKVLEDVRIGETGGSYLVPDFLPGSDQIAFQDGAGSLWRGSIDLRTGFFLTSSGRDAGVDTNLAQPGLAMDGPQWGRSAGGAAIYYTKPGAGARFQIWRAGSEVQQLTTNAVADSFGARVTQDAASATVKMVFNRGTLAASAAMAADESAPANAVALPDQAPVERNGRWIPGTNDVVYVRTAPVAGGVTQLARFHTGSGSSTILTDDGGNKSDAWAFIAPEFGNELCYAAVIERLGIAIYRNLHRPDGVFDRVDILAVPVNSTARYLYFVKPLQGQRGFNGVSWFSCNAYQNNDPANPGASAVVLLGLGPDGNHRLPLPPPPPPARSDLCEEWMPLTLRLDDPDAAGVAFDPDTVIGEQEVFCYYSRRTGPEPVQLRMTRAGLVRTDWAGEPTGFTGMAFTRDYTPGTVDVSGQRMGGTETRALVAHDGKLFAALGSRDNTVAGPGWTGAQILVKTGPGAPWQVDHTGAVSALFTAHEAVEVLTELTFTKQGVLPLGSPVKHLVASLSDVSGSPGGAVVSARTRTATGDWVHSNIATTSVPAYALSFAVHLDRDVNNDGVDENGNAAIERVFAGLSNGEIYRGVFDTGDAGKLVWSATAEFPGATVKLGPVTSMVEANGRLYAACGKRQEANGDPVAGGIYVRNDHTDAWMPVYSWPSPVPVHSAPVEHLVATGLTAVADPRGCSHHVLLAARSWPGVIERIDPGRDHAVSVELDVRDFYARHWNAPELWNRDIRIGYTPFTPVTDPVTGENVHLLGLWIDRPGAAIPGDSHFLVRHSDGTYEAAEVSNFLPVLPAGQSLRACRCIAVSPFAELRGAACYFGGYDTAGENSRDTAWILRGDWAAWPGLVISRPEPPAFQLVWPATSFDWTLESSTTLGATTWQPVPEPPTRSLTVTTLSVLRDDPRMFFRLRRR